MVGGGTRVHFMLRPVDLSALSMEADEDDGLQHVSHAACSQAFMRWECRGRESAIWGRRPFQKSLGLEASWSLQTASR